MKILFQPNAPSREYCFKGCVVFFFSSLFWITSLSSQPFTIAYTEVLAQTSVQLPSNTEILDDFDNRTDGTAAEAFLTHTRTATDLFAESTHWARAEFGRLRTTGSVSIDYALTPAGGTVSASAGNTSPNSGNARFRDTFTLSGSSGTADVRFSLRLHTIHTSDPSFSNSGTSRLDFLLQNTSFTPLSAQTIQITGPGEQAENLFWDVTLNRGTTYYISAFLGISALKVRTSFGLASETILADQTGSFGIEILTPGVDYVTESGTLYTPVPEPATIALVALVGIFTVWRRMRAGPAMKQIRREINGNPFAAIRQTAHTRRRDTSFGG